MKVRDQRLIAIAAALVLILIGFLVWRSCVRKWTKPLKIEVVEILNKADERKGTDWYLHLKVTNLTGSAVDIKPTDFRVIDDKSKRYSYVHLRDKPTPTLSASLESDKGRDGWLTFHLPFGPRPVKLIYRCSLNGKSYLYKFYP